MTKILMVCLGNICRSPLAHGILQSKLDDDNFYTDSAGTASYHIGEQPDYRSINVAKLKGIDISQQKARQFKATDFDTFDIIYAMDQSNYSNIIGLARSNEDIDKVKLFLDENLNVQNKNVPDPYYGDMTDFEFVFDLIDKTCEIIVKQLYK
ncbi:low molecular weight phosphotyrosine protein phosphatase [Winogradskyella sp. DF17]|uniref:protein-tyrosine-phosphatase n=1 Tax=Winogradskyella pelagia TaxID=2819984 RepID=A0ABS3T3M1_9FLAO|nr:low molecular weight protein-tyrosine-phosphatase [Winogradskyella sp. DF17]MBO3117337.1 low molecular weight phosphotyrosine protein phosphatase [Winogradskyella sp. DF17]